jgi:hypothetical protein
VPRSTQRIVVADHLWDALGRMAEEMGSDRDALVNQALHVFARLNGYVVPGAPAGEGVRAPAVPAPTPPPTGPERKAIAERVIQAAERLERDLPVRPPPVPPAPLSAGALRLVREGGVVLEVDRERYVIGRGAHCDLVIDSAKISREHAALARCADGWWIEDLGSSNGTWFAGERISRRRVEHGDEYFLSAEKVRCELR